MKVLIAAAEAPSFSQAARTLGISQPAVSIKLKELERQTRLPVFRLQGKRKVLTHFGRALFEVARAQSAAFDSAYERVSRDYLLPEKLTLKVGGRPEVLEAALPALEFGGAFELHSLSGQQAVSALLTHSIDIAITSEPAPDSAEIVARRLFSSHGLLVVARRLLPHKRPRRPHLDREFLTQTPCLLYQRDGHLLSDLFKSTGLSIESARPSVVAEDWRLLLSLARQGKGYTVVPSYLVGRLKEPELAIFEIPATICRPRQFSALFHRDLKRVPGFARLFA